MKSKRKSTKPIKTFSWYTGVYQENELTVEIYAGKIRWLEKMDPQWSDSPKEEIQKFEDFLEKGSPKFFEWHLLGEGIERKIRSTVKAIQKEGVKQKSASQLPPA